MCIARSNLEGFVVKAGQGVQGTLFGRHRSGLDVLLVDTTLE